MSVNRRSKARRLKRLISIYVKNKPYWAEQPEALQLDTQHSCNLNCVYCNVAPGHSFGLQYARMPDNIIDRALMEFKHLGWQNKLMDVRPFLDGKPMLEPRLPEIADKVRRILNVHSWVFTNGTVYENKGLLLHRDMDVRFTICAYSPETYLKVHGKALLDQADKTLDWLATNRFPTQKVFVSFIATKFNIHELQAWAEKYYSYERDVWPLHYSPMQNDSLNSMTGSLLAPKSIQIYTPESQLLRLRWGFPYKFPCQQWGVMAISPEGNFMHCMDMPPKYHWGNIEEINLAEAWQKRNDTRGNHECCRTCSQRLPNHKEIFERYLD